MSLMVRSMTTESDGVLSLELVDPGGAALPEWQPGAHIDVTLADGMSRQYSLCGDWLDRYRYRLGILREEAGRGGSAYVHETLRPGDLVEFSGPRNHFRLVRSPNYIFIAGGIGITPILPMIAKAAYYDMSWTLLYGGRTRGSMAFTNQLSRYRNRVNLHPQDESGLPDLKSLLESPQKDTLVYCCGPEPLLKAVEDQMSAWPTGSLHVERFVAPEDQPQRDPADEDSIEVVLADSGRTVLVPPERSILDVLLEEGVDILSDCQEGICGTCETKVIEGEVDHRDYVLTDAEKEANTCMMVCCSRACGKKLVLGL